MIGKAPFGMWELSLPDTAEVRSWLQGNLIQDIILLVTFSARTPPWPRRGLRMEPESIGWTMPESSCAAGLSPPAQLLERGSRRVWRMGSLASPWAASRRRTKSTQYVTSAM